MTKVQKRCFELAVKKNNMLLAVKLALCACIENNNTMYLPNVYSGYLSNIMSKNQFAGYLSVLEKQGFYGSYHDNHFGFIK